MARRRDVQTPLEIMRQNAPGPAVEAPQEYAPRLGWADQLKEVWDAGVPVVLRVPRGVAIAACAGVLALMVLSYWVGYSRGSSATAERLKVEYEQGGRPDRVPDATARIVVPDTGRPSAEGMGAQEPRPVSRDPRVVGLNYVVLAMYPRVEADRLAMFLAGRGVETVVVPTDNAELFHVVGLAGFTTEQYRAGEHREYERRMKQLGRDWRAFNDNKGLDLSDMYWKLFTGPR